MSVQMDERFAVALRELLVEEVHRSTVKRRWLPRLRRRVVAAGAAVAIAAGGGIAYATGAFKTIPGGNQVTDLGTPVTVTGAGTQTVQLGPQPAGTNALDITFTCLTAGNFTFADGAGLDCTSAGGSTRSRTTFFTLNVTPGQDSTTITATPGARWRLTVSYSTVRTTAWGVNASGQTYGMQNQHGTPDLVAVQATNGRTGYVYANQLYQPLPNKLPTAAQALAEHNFPPKTLTVYKSDGKTPIGKFTIDHGGGTGTGH